MGGGTGKQRQRRDGGLVVPDLDLGSWRSLCHVGSVSPPPGFVHFWERVRRAAYEADSRIEAATGEGGATHGITSTDGVRVAARVTLGEGVGSLEQSPAVVVALHGYDVGPEIDDHAHLARAGASVLSVRVRGFPGTPDPLGEHGPFLTRRIEDRQAWALTGAVIDVMCACLSVRRLCGPRTLLGLAGESFGGGLAILAASQLTGADAIDRLVVGVPSLGEWGWRLTREPGEGAGAEASAYLSSAGEGERRVRANLALFDTVVHARRVCSPALVKIARRDRVVPPPTVAAIYNALGTGAGHKWRFVTASGHEDSASPEELRRHALFRRLAGAFCASADPAGMMAAHERELTA